MKGESVASPHPWDGFLIGPENSLAHAGALALARGDREGVSPLVVHGPAGVGKTRLLAGLVAERLIRRPESAVAHVEAETFAASCAGAADRAGGWREVRDRFRRLDLLVLDDIQSLERTPWALEELAHTLDALDEAGGAVAVGARTGPGGWKRWPERLVSRLTAGLAVAIERPAVESRRRYLLDQVRSHKLALPIEAVEPLAEAADGYRTIDGWLAQLALTAQVNRRVVPPSELVAAILQGDPIAAGPDLAAITRAVAGVCGVKVGDLRSDTRRAVVAEARHLAIHLARTFTPLSFRAIGAYFGGRDPATIRHAASVAQARLAADAELAAVVAALTQDWSRPAADAPD